MSQSSASKEELRLRILALRDSLPAEERDRLADVIQRRLFYTHEFSIASRVAFFASCRSEVPTARMIRDALLLGKKVFLPITNSKLRRLDFHLIEDAERDLRPGAYGIPEPIPGGDSMPCSDLDVIVTPGAAFDLLGHRVGYGGGYYDRTFSEAGDGPVRVGLAFELQVVDRIPRGPADLPVHLLVTEKRLLRFDS